MESRAPRGGAQDRRGGSGAIQGFARPRRTASGVPQQERSAHGIRAARFGSRQGTDAETLAPTSSRRRAACFQQGSGSGKGSVAGDEPSDERPRTVAVRGSSLPV